MRTHSDTEGWPHEDSHLQTKETGLQVNQLANTVSLSFSLTELWEHVFLLKPPRLWYFVIVALANEHIHLAIWKKLCIFFHYMLFLSKIMVCWNSTLSLIPKQAKLTHSLELFTFFIWMQKPRIKLSVLRNLPDITYPTDSVPPVKTTRSDPWKSWPRHIASLCEF
jgi:hypothetical protein